MQKPAVDERTAGFEFLTALHHIKPQPGDPGWGAMQLAGLLLYYIQGHGSDDTTLLTMNCRSDGALPELPGM